MAISRFEQTDERAGIKCSFKFFENLQREHQVLLNVLNQKIEETTQIVDTLNFSKAEKIRREQQPLKNKIFEVLKLIYEQQKAIGKQLYTVDSQVKVLRTEFTNQIIANNPFLTFEDVDAMFKKYDISFEVDKAMKELQQKNQSNKLASMFNKSVTFTNTPTPSGQNQTKKDDVNESKNIAQMTHNEAVTRFAHDFYFNKRLPENQMDKLQGGQKSQLTQSEHLTGLKRGPSSHLISKEDFNEVTEPLKLVRSERDGYDFKYYKPTLLRSQTQLSELDSSFINPTNSEKLRFHQFQQMPQSRFRISHQPLSALSLRREQKAELHHHKQQAKNYEQFEGQGSSNYERPRRRTNLFETQSTMDQSGRSGQPIQIGRGHLNFDHVRMRTLIRNPL